MRNRGGARWRGVARKESASRGMGWGQGRLGESVASQTGGEGGRWAGDSAAVAGAELRQIGRRKKGGRDLFGICENSRDFTVNKDFPLF